MNSDDDLTATLKFIAEVGRGCKIDTRRMTTIPTGPLYSLVRTVWYTDTRVNTEKLLCATIESSTERLRAAYTAYRALLAAELPNARAVPEDNKTRAHTASDTTAAADSYMRAQLLRYYSDLARYEEASSAAQVSDHAHTQGQECFGDANNGYIPAAGAPFIPFVPVPDGFSQDEKKANSQTTPPAQTAAEEPTSQSLVLRARIERYYADIAAARVGIDNLVSTYGDALHFRSRLVTIRDKVDRFLAEFSIFSSEKTSVEQRAWRASEV